MPAIESIPGLRELWGLTTGDPAVRVALIDGPVDQTHPAFEGARISVVRPHRPPPGDPTGYKREHATWTASVLVGQHGGPVTGFAPGCTCLSVPAFNDQACMQDPLNLASAIEAAADAGADVIIAQACQPTMSGHADPLVRDAVRRAEASNVLVVAGSGNDDGECRCAPAVLPEVLAVGAYDDDGRVFRFSGWGYGGHGIVAPGGNISGAWP